MAQIRKDFNILHLNLTIRLFKWKLPLSRQLLKRGVNLTIRLFKWRAPLSSLETASQGRGEYHDTTPQVTGASRETASQARGVSHDTTLQVTGASLEAASRQLLKGGVNLTTRLLKWRAPLSRQLLKWETVDDKG